MESGAKVIAFAALSVVVFLGASCPGERSADPTIAMEQDFVAACSQMAAGMRTAIALRKAGQLSELAIQTVGHIKTVYVGVCTGEPQPMTSALQDAALAAAVVELCPALKVGDDLVITVAMAAVCAGNQYLLAELEEPQ